MAGWLVSPGNVDSTDTPNALETAYATHVTHSPDSTYTAYSFDPPGRLVTEELAAVVGMMLSSGLIDMGSLCHFARCPPPSCTPGNSDVKYHRQA